MMKPQAPLVRDYMTRLPTESERCETIAEAEALMAKQQIRHLPVMSGSHLRGIISHQDILAARARAGSALDSEPVENLCESDVLTVEPLTRVNEVAQRMLDRRVGSAVVVDGGFVVGIFTNSDALRVLTERFS